MRPDDDMFLTALTLAARSYLDHAFDDPPAEEADVQRICATLGWSDVRARWFISVNRDSIKRFAQELRTQQPPEN